MKKIANVILAGILCASTLFAVGCGGYETVCVHNVGTWEVTTPATCTKEGEESGVCGVCLETQKRAIPADPSAHVYGDWAVSQPTETAVGKAVKTCTENSAHILETELPSLTSTKYLSEIVERPTAAKEGMRSYEFKHEAGNVTFTRPIPNTGIRSVMDAVELGASAESRALVRSAEGETGYFYYQSGDTLASNSPTKLTKQYYEFGDKYTYILDGVKDPDSGLITGGADNCERWYFTASDGVLYGLTNYLDGRTQTTKITNDFLGNGQKDYVNGSRLYLQYANGLGTYFGVESFLEGLYRNARMSINGDFTQSATEVGDKMEYSFSFGYVNNSGADGHFAKTTVKFTLTSSYVIESMKAESVIYINNVGLDIHTWEMDEETGYAHVLPGQEQGARYVSTVAFTQTEQAAGDVVPQNPHTTEKFYVNDFDVLYQGQPVANGQEIPLAVNGSTQRVFAIDNVKPQDVFNKYSFDQFGFYLRTGEGENEVDTPLSFDSSSTITVYLESSDNTFALNSKLSGLQKIVIKTKNAEKVLLCRFSEAAPSALNPKVYVYNRTTKEYNDWVQPTQNRVTNHYVGQPFYFTAEVPESEKNYAAPNYTYTVKKEGVPVDASCLGYALRGGKNAVQFTPKEAGVYTVTMTSELGNKVCTILLTVIDAPTFENLTATNKTYAGELELSIADVKVTFKDYAATATGYTATATVEKWESGQLTATEELTCTYQIGEISGQWELSSAHKSGSELGYLLGLNEAYDFVVSHYFQIDANFSEWEQTVLTEQA